MVPNGWENTRLKNIAKIKSGSTPLRAKQDLYYSKDGTPWIKTLDLNNSDILTTDEKITDLALQETSCSVFPINTVLVAMYGGFNQIGRTGLITVPSAINQALSGLVLNEEKAHPRYVLNYLNGNVKQWKKFAASSRKDPNITREDVCSFEILLPPLPEQRKIAKILSTWDKAISATERLIDNSKQQKKALMQQLLTGKKRLLDDKGKPFEGEWETAILSDIGKVSIGLVTTMTKYYVDDGIPLIRNSDIKPNTINKTKMLQLCSDFSSDYDNRKLRKGDIVTVHTGEVGVSSVIDDELDWCIGFATLNTRPNISKVNSQYLSWYFNSERFINWCVSMSTGDGRQNLNLKDFIKAKVLLPSLEEQHKIVSVLKNADQEIELLEHQLADLKQEKKALMQQLLTGKRRVKVEDEVAA